MDDSRILIVGAYGQLGIAFKQRFANAIATDREQLDITSWESVKNFDWSNVDTILNAAAYTSVDEAETPEGREAAWKVNAVAVGYLARVAAEHDITVVHVSTEYVFDGTKAPHGEDEPFTPLGVYAQSKAAGDIAAATAPKHYILRTSWVIGEGKNFVRTMIGLAQKGISPTVVDDQIGRLTFTKTLVDAAEHLLTTKAVYGVYNISDDGEPASWAEITRTIFKDMGRGDLSVTGTTTAKYFAGKPNISPRPLRSEMNLSKITGTGLVLPDWRQNLQAYITNELHKEQL